MRSFDFLEIFRYAKNMGNENSQIQNTKDNELDILLSNEGSVSPEEKEEITSQIEKVVQENRIVYEPSLMKTKASSGLGLTFTINLLLALITIGGIGIVFTFFQPNASSELIQDSQILTTEARLLDEIKREASLALNNKDREIAEIQSRLANIDKERSAILTDTEAKIRAKEQELELRLQSEIERERQRLLAQGLGQAEIERRIQELTERRRKEIEAELQAFRIQAEQERRRLERALDEAQENYRATLNAAALERQKILEDVRTRESELQGRTQTISTQLQQAQTELSQLRARAEQLSSLDNQIFGLILRARDLYAQSKWKELKETSALIAEVARLPAYEQDAQTLNRRQGHLLLSQALMNIADSRLAQEQSVQNQDGASLSVSQALALQEAWVQAESLLRAAENDFRRENYEEAINKSLRAISLVNLNVSGSNFFQRWVDLGAQRAIDEKIKKDSEEGLNLFRQAQALRTSNPVQSRQLINQLLIQYPLAEQRVDSLRLLQQLANDAEGSFTFRISALEQELAQARSLQGQTPATISNTEIDRLRAENTQSQQQIQNLRQQIASLEKQVEDQRQQLAMRQQQSAPTTTSANSEEINQLRAKTIQLESDLNQARALLAQTQQNLQRVQQERLNDASLAQRFQNLRESYGSFSQAFNALGENQELERQQLLNTFLVQLSEPDNFPQIKARIDRAIQASRNAGQKESLYYASDILEGTTVLTTASSRQSYFSNLRTRYRNDPSMLDFLNTLERYVSNRVN